MSFKQIKRKITVEIASKSSSGQPKSVFERLGTKTVTSSSSQSSSDYCRYWSQSGTCPYGKNCNYASTHTLTSPSKRAARIDEQKKQSRTTTTSAAGGGGGKNDLNKRLHSTIVKASFRSPESEWEQWNQTDLEDADAEMLEIRRQELQRELQLQMKIESKLTKMKDKATGGGNRGTAKKGAGGSSSSSNSSRSSAESSSSSEETSSTSSSTSLDSRNCKTKRTKAKRDNSSSTEPERFKKRPASLSATSKTNHKYLSSSGVKTAADKKRISSFALNASGAKQLKTASPPPRNTNISNTSRLSQTSPLKLSKKLGASSAATVTAKSGGGNQKKSFFRSSPREEKHRHQTATPSPEVLGSQAAYGWERDLVKDKEKASRDFKEWKKGRDKKRDRDKDKDVRASREMKKARKRDKVRERSSTAKSNSLRSPKRVTSTKLRDPHKKEDSLITAAAFDAQKFRSSTTSNNGSKRDSFSSNKNNSPVTTASLNSKEKEDRRLERDNGSSSSSSKKKEERERRDRDRERERDRDVVERRKVKDKEKEKERDNKRDTSGDRDMRERERERRMMREEREAVRIKEREKELARCQERQRERLKEFANKARENIPFLLHINMGADSTGAANRLRERERDRKPERERDRERERQRDHGLDKPLADRVERMLPLPADRIPPMRKDLDRQATRSQDRASNRSSHRPDRNRSINRGGNNSRVVDRDRGAGNFDYRESRDCKRGDRNRDRDRGRDRERDFAAIGLRERGARHEYKNYESPYRRDERSTYLELKHEHYDGGGREHERDYPDERRGRGGGARRDAWNSRDTKAEQLVALEEERHARVGGYGRDRDRDRKRDRDRERDRDEARPLPVVIKERGNWAQILPEYMNRTERACSRRGVDPGAVGAAHDWLDDWEPAERASLEDEWRHFNRSVDSWPSGQNRRRWHQVFPERRPGLTSTNAHRDIVDEPHLPLEPLVTSILPAISTSTSTSTLTLTSIPNFAPASASASIAEDIKKNVILGKRIAGPTIVVDVLEVKKKCVAIEDTTSILEDALSEISDDADEILNREDEPTDQSTNKTVASAEMLKHTGTGTVETNITEIKVEAPETQEIATNNDLRQLHEADEDPMYEDGIDHMDFEEISDEELEEEVKVKGLGDALGVDWASLVAESRPRPKQDKEAGSAKKRWEYTNVLARIGVSVAMAGKEIATEILGPDIKEPIAAIQVAAREKAQIRSNLFASAGPCRRALSARRDLSIRRHLCNLPFSEHRPKTPDPQFYQTVLNTITIRY